MPSIGTFQIKFNSAQFDIPGRSILPPSCSFVFMQGGNSPSKQFFKCLAETLGISESDAISRFNEFATDLKNKISGGSKIKWNGIGELFTGVGGEIKFIPEQKEILLGDPVPAQKIIHKHAKHQVMVGEQEKTSEEMIEILGAEESKKQQWWVYALIAGMVAVIFIGFYFSVNGFNVSSSGSRQKVSPVEITATHDDLP